MGTSTFKRLACCAIFTVLAPLTSYGWNATGHMVVADIAYQNLTPTARKTVDGLVGQLNKEYPEMKTFMNISYWPDSIRSQRIESFTHWHYVDHAFSTDGTALKDVVDTDNAVWAVNTIKGVVKNDKANAFDRVRFLSFLTHIVADLHQPLHTVSYFSAAHTGGDRGGNSYNVRVNNERINVHKLWDGGVGVFANDNTFVKASAVSTAIQEQYPQTYFGDRATNINAEDWAKEGMENAKTYVYNTPENQDVSSTYIANGKELAKQQAALAGYRLAALLNQLLG